MGINEAPSIAAALARRMHDGVPAAQVAAEVAAIWRQVEASLIPIVGPGGVFALYERSLLLAGRFHPWLIELHGESQGAVDIEALTTLLAHRMGDTAALGGGELLETFYTLLSSVIGPTLTRRLLPFMWQSFEEPVSRKSP